jgi:pyridoxamine 5'-phosphate oxidase
MSIEELRQEYTRHELDERTVRPDPFEQFRVWFDEARSAGIMEPNGMTLATADAAGRPSARIVLLKQIDERGFVFFSHYTSRKGRELAANPHAALLFWWDVLERQVRIEGTTEPTDAETSDAYFRSRPEGSRFGAAASEQSEVVAGREVLERRMVELRTKYPDGNVPRPEMWGGTRVVPVSFEFWQGRPNRVHDRVRYRKDGDKWVIERLAP